MMKEYLAGLANFIRLAALRHEFAARMLHEVERRLHRKQAPGQPLQDALTASKAAQDYEKQIQMVRLPPAQAAPLASEPYEPTARNMRRD
jgi:hypothetical protein